MPSGDAAIFDLCPEEGSFKKLFALLKAKNKVIIPL